MAKATSVQCPSEICFNPLSNDLNASAIKTLLQIIKTCIGPRGKLKIIQNISGGHVSVTSSSQRIFHNVSVKNYLLKFIIASAQSHLKFFGDGGLSCALLILRLIENSLTLKCPLPLLGTLYDHFGKIYIECLSLENNSCNLNVDFSNITDLLCVVNSLLNSKPGCILSADDKNHLSLLLLTAFLDVIPCNTAKTLDNYNIKLLRQEGFNVRQSKLYEGLLIKNTQEIYQQTCSVLNADFGALKIALFTISLAGDADFPVEKLEVNDAISVWESILSHLEKIASELISGKVNIVACQKVVHPRIRKRLEDANILVFDRLGNETTKYLQFISGGFSNCSLFSKLSFGLLTSIKQETVGKHSFFLLCNKDKPFKTFMICNYNEETLNEMQTVCQQVIDTLFRLLKKPRVCFGAGCTEMYLSSVVKEKVKERLDEIVKETECTHTQALEALYIFLKSIVDVSVSINQGSLLGFITETSHAHLWKIQNGKCPANNDKCMCGQYIATDDHYEWKFFPPSFNNWLVMSEEKFIEKSESCKGSIILDELSCKISAFSVAFETASLLLKVSLCVYPSL
ncbi:McKusick-Kaufman/Bardet-Biedl syndromes putative chaperonin-like [Stegodyphus dumicola]|uniref:McKusick-Kaufman/Bardet-Biedl syndromes putative chaperonin-like n=1 Tax=Stegodyphus dumicola TaxID=202533 RepID=UPI0015A8651D|nr:McKusick-Kaufman/Bardet-Biedl syndromes putative chaperonin-like [Stegodyphus dumicola]